MACDCNQKKRPTVIPIGYAGERYVRTIPLYIGDLQEQWPGLIPVMTVQRPGEATMYPAANTTIDGEYLTWHFTAYDLGAEGIGKCQIEMKDPNGEPLGKSEIMLTSVAESLKGPEKAPEWYDSYIQRIIDQAVRAEAAQMAAEVSADSANDWAVQSEEYARWSELYAGNAEDAANNASQQAVNAASSAGTAHGWAVASEGYAGRSREQADEAKSQADAAKKHAEDAETSAQNAFGTAERAKTWAETAEQHKDDAATQANIALSGAERAETAASSAGQNAYFINMIGQQVQQTGQTVQAAAAEAAANAERADGWATQAENDAKAAKDSKLAAESAAQTAISKSDSAISSARSAETAASTANNAAGIASGVANAVQQMTQGFDQKVTNGLTAIQTKTDEQLERIPEVAELSAKVNKATPVVLKYNGTSIYNGTKQVGYTEIKQIIDGGNPVILRDNQNNVYQLIYEKTTAPSEMIEFSVLNGKHVSGIQIDKFGNVMPYSVTLADESLANYGYWAYEYAEQLDEAKAEKSDVTALDADVKVLKDDLTQLKSVTVYESQESEIKNVTDELTFEDGYYNINGGKYDSTAYRYAIVSVTAGDEYNRGPNLSNIFRFVTAYIDGVASPTDGAQNVNSYIVPDGVNSLILSIQANRIDAEAVIRVRETRIYKNAVEDRVSALEAKGDADVDKLIETIDKFGSVVPSVNLFDSHIDSVTGFITNTGAIITDGSYVAYVTSDFMPLPDGTYTLYQTYDSSMQRMPVAVYDADYNLIYYSGRDTVESTVFTLAADGYIRFSIAAKYWDGLMLINGTNIVPYAPYGDTTLLNDTIKVFPNNPVLLDTILKSNVLLGKKYIACGDSYTAWSDGAYPDGIFKGTTVNYWREIILRNSMSTDNSVLYAESGSTIALAKDDAPTKATVDAKAFANTKYLSIPEDADYITIAYGINDSALCNLGQLGDTENTTFYGAWHKVLTWLATNRPSAKVGIIIFQRNNNEYYRAVKEIAEYHGVPYLDFYGGTNTPMYVDGKAYPVDAEVKALRHDYFCGHAHTANESDVYQGREVLTRIENANPSHPGYRAHIDEAKIIEQFLRGL